MSVDVDPGKLPADWRKVVRSGAFVILLTMGVAAVAAPVSIATSKPLEAKLGRHLAESEALRPVMQQYVNDQRQINCGIARNIFELCHATPGAKCVPMGAGCP